MIKIDSVDLNIISEEYFQYLYTWLFDKGNFDKWKATFSLPLDDIQLKCYNFLCSKMEVARKQSLRAVLRTLIKIYTFAPNFKFGTK